jgi:hypothetical protein
MRIDGCNVGVGNWIVASVKDPSDGRIFGLMGKVIRESDDPTTDNWIGVKVYHSRDAIKVTRDQVQRLDVVTRPLPTTEEVEAKALELLTRWFG